jgi:hypothetical protein
MAKILVVLGWAVAGIALTVRWWPPAQWSAAPPVSRLRTNRQTLPGALPSPIAGDDPMLNRVAAPGGDRGESAAADSSATEAPPDADAIPGEYVLRFYDARDMAAFAAAADALGAQVVGRMDGANLLRVRVRSAAQWEALLARGPTPLEQSANHLVRVPERAAVPAEPPAGVSYAAVGGRSVAMLGQHGIVPLGGEAVRVAILDTGVLPHWAYAGTTLQAIDLLEHAGAEGLALEGHGTAVASLVAGADPRLVGVAPGVELLSVRVMDGAGQGDAFTVAAGIMAAVDAGATVINLSLGTHGDNVALRSAVAYAEAHGVVLVAAVGNDGLAQVMYPALYPTVLAVGGAVDAAGQALYFSNTGNAVDLAAPGYGVLAAWTNGQVVTFSGTSAAAPFVSGAVARLLSMDPALSPEAVRMALRQVGNDAGAPGEDPVYGAGILDLARLAALTTPGIHDLAARAPYVLSGKVAGEPVRAAFYAQNVGTATADIVELRVTLDGNLHVFRDFHVAPGGTVAHELLIGQVGPTDRQIAFRVTAILGAADDSAPANNTVSGTLTIYGVGW